MRNTFGMAILCAVLVMALAASAPGAEKPTYGSVSGTVLSVAEDGKSMKIRQKDESEIEASIRANRLFSTWRGTVDDLGDQRPVEVAGKIADDNSKVVATSIVCYTGHGRGGNRIISNRKRVDGILVQKNEEWDLKYKDGQMAVELSPKVRVTVRAPLAVKDIKTGARVSIYGKLEPGKVDPSFTCVAGKPE